MEFETIDARGLSCPQPVVLVRKAILEDKLPAEVVVESVTSRENIKRMASKMGCTVTVQEEGAEFRLRVTKR